MFQVIGKQNLNLTTKRLDIRADALVARMKPGHFVSIMPDHFSRRVPMNVYEIDWRRKCLSIVFEEVDTETRKLGEMKINDEVFLVAGPYGQPCRIEKEGTILCVGEGIRLGSIVFLARSFKQAGNKVIGIAGFDTRKGSILENQIRLNCNKFYVMYKDGMHERRGDLLTPLKKILEEEKVTSIYVHVTLEMLKDIYYLALEKNIPLILNIMDLLSAKPNFFEDGHIFLNEKRFFPAAEGIFVNAADVNIKDLIRQVDSLKEYKECQKRQAESLAPRSVFARFKKFIWG